MSKVYNLNGEQLHSYENPGEPVVDVVDALEHALEKAKAGEIAGIALVALARDNSTEMWITGRRQMALVGRAAVMAQILVDEMK